MPEVYCRLNNDWLLKVLTSMGVNPILIGTEQVRLAEGDVLICGESTSYRVKISAYRGTGSTDTRYKARLIYTNTYNFSDESCMDCICCCCLVPTFIRYYGLYCAVYIPKDKKSTGRQNMPPLVPSGRQENVQERQSLIQEIQQRSSAPTLIDLPIAELVDQNGKPLGLVQQ